MRRLFHWKVWDQQKCWTLNNIVCGERPGPKTDLAGSLESDFIDFSMSRVLRWTAQVKCDQRWLIISQCAYGHTHEMHTFIRTCLTVQNAEFCEGTFSWYFGFPPHWKSYHVVWMFEALRAFCDSLKIGRVFLFQIFSSPGDVPEWLFHRTNGFAVAIVAALALVWWQFNAGLLIWMHVGQKGRQWDPFQWLEK